MSAEAATGTVPLSTAAPSGPAPVAPAAPKPQSLDEVMMAMDVVDTLRHNENLVAEELSQDDRDHTLKARLRELYESQGLTVSDAVLDQGIKALKESRFTYVAPKESWALTLARLWVRRTALGLWAATGLAAFGIGWGGYYYGFVAPKQAAEAQVRVALADELPRALEDAYVQVINLAQEDEAKRQAGALRADGRFGLGRKDPEAVRKTIADLLALHKTLQQEFQVRVMREPSGVERTPDENPRARNYYLIVQALAPDGSVVPQNIKSEETGRTKTVNRWAVRVSQDLYRAVQKDKRQDGIIQVDLVAEKKRGFLGPSNVMPIDGGAITEWEE